MQRYLVVVILYGRIFAPYLYTFTTNVTFYSTQLVDTLHYKPEGRMISPRWSHWDFLIDLFLPSALWSWSQLSLFNRNEYQVSLLGGKGDQCDGLTIVPSSCAGCVEILGASTFRNPQDLYS